MIADSLLPEFDRETAVTRLVLERVPDEKAAWRPHHKSRSMGELASHVAGLAQWVPLALKRAQFDFGQPEGEAVRAAPFDTTARLLAAYDERVAAARAAIVATSDAEMMASWTLRNGGRIVFTAPRLTVFRSFVMNHLIHHRGQLTVYLRLCDVPLPPIYGPTADASPEP